MLALFPLLFACQEKPATATCDYNGMTYTVGETFDAGDGCNSCSCDEYEGETSVACTEMDCSSVEPSACADLSVDTCANDERCTVIYASQAAFMEDDECFAWANSIEEVGCMDADAGCGQAFTHAASSEDPSGCYGFSNTCIPEGWGDCSQGTYPECEY